MKHLKTYKIYNNLILERNINGIFYHGSPYKFRKFNNKTSYFTDSEKFSIDYSEQKSMDYGMDNDTNIYKVKIITNLFDINNIDDYEKLENVLPNKVKYAYNDFGFDTTVSKSEILLNMKGLDKVEPIDSVLNGSIGDTFPNPEYHRERYIILYKDNEYAYCLLEDTYNRYVETPLDKVYNSKIFYSGNNKIDKLLSDSIDYINDYIENNTEGYVNSSIKRDYLELFKENKNYYQTNNLIIDKKDINKFKYIYNIDVEKVRKFILNNDIAKKFTLIDRIIKLENTWRFFENDTVHNYINKLGYGGYVSLERGIKTYAIFEPDKDVQIISYNFPYEFSSYDEYKEYVKYMENLYKHSKDSSNVSSFKVYKDFKSNRNELVE